jgi:antitoxin component YwqK of YwqJK toxin-antitoxin module
MENEIKREYWPDGKLHCEWSYVNGVKHGLQKWYFDNGQLCFKYHMRNGQYHGTGQNWHRDERRNCVKQWKNHQLNGPHITFNY